LRALTAKQNNAKTFLFGGRTVIFLPWVVTDQNGKWVTTHPLDPPSIPLVIQHCYRVSSFESFARSKSKFTHFHPFSKAMRSDRRATTQPFATSELPLRRRRHGPWDPPAPRIQESPLTWPTPSKTVGNFDEFPQFFSSAENDFLICFLAVKPINHS